MAYRGTHMGGHSMGGAHIGQDQVERVAKLVDAKQRLEDALPMADNTSAMKIEARLDQIEAQLSREMDRARQLGTVEQIRSAIGLNGMGGMDFQVQSPAGKCRLLKLPFYAKVAPTGGTGSYVTAAGAGAASETVPTITYLAAAGAAANQPQLSAGGLIQLETPQISWATLRIVGFEVEVSGTSSDVNGATFTNSNTFPIPKLAVSDLKIGGGANLFTHEDLADASIYDSAQPEFCGLRDYPILKSPNVAQVNAAVLGFNGGDTAASFTLTFACSLLCEVLEDDNYGTNIPGPYARGAAIQRRGGSFM